MRYYQVTAKCGHVGKNYYYRGVFFVNASNGREAAQIVRWKPRVKHHHKDAILEVLEVPYYEYKSGLSATAMNPYFHCSNSYEQNCRHDEIYSDVVEEQYDTKKNQCYTGGSKNRRKRREGKMRTDRYEPDIGSFIRDYLYEAV